MQGGHQAKLLRVLPKWRWSRTRCAEFPLLNYVTPLCSVLFIRGIQWRQCAKCLWGEHPLVSMYQSSGVLKRKIVVEHQLCALYKHETAWAILLSLEMWEPYRNPRSETPTKGQPWRMAASGLTLLGVPVRFHLQGCPHLLTTTKPGSLQQPPWGIPEP